MSKNEIEQITENAVRIAKRKCGVDLKIAESARQTELDLNAGVVGHVAAALINAAAISKEFREALLQN